MLASTASSTAATATSVNGDTTNMANDSSSNNSSNGSSTTNCNIRLNVNEKARTVTSVCTSGTLCTISYENDITGAPFGSFVDYVLDDSGHPILLMNDMSMHTINIQKAQSAAAAAEGNAMVTLFTQLSSTTNPAGTGSSSSGGSRAAGGASAKGLQDVSRCSITGTLTQLDATDPQMDSIRMKYSLTHSSYADQVMDSPKFRFYRLVPQKIYFVGGYGVLAKWVDVQEYQRASPDILAKDAYDITQRINRDHVTDLQYVGQYLLQVEDIVTMRLTNLDRLGMDIRITAQTGQRKNKLITDEYRIGFRIPIRSVEDAKSEVLKIFQDAWEIGNGYTWNDDDSSDDDTATMIPILKIAADSLE